MANDGAETASEPLYSAEQIHIPSDLPDILKQFTKAAIKTRPDNLMQWAADYFSALADGRAPPVASRVTILAAPAAGTAGDSSSSSSSSLADLTFAHLAALTLELSEGGDCVGKTALIDACARLKFPEQAVKDALGVGDFGDIVPWRTFVALEAATLQPGMQDTLAIMARLFSKEGTAAGGIPFTVFREVYTFLGGLDSDMAGSIESTLKGLAGRAVVHIADLEGAISFDATEEQAEAEAVGEQLRQEPVGRSISAAPEGDPPSGLEVIGHHTGEPLPDMADVAMANHAEDMAPEEGEEAGELQEEDSPTLGRDEAADWSEVPAVDLVVEGMHIEPEDVTAGETEGPVTEPLAAAEAETEAAASEVVPVEDVTGDVVDGLVVEGEHVNVEAAEKAVEAEEDAAEAE